MAGGGRRMVYLKINRNNQYTMWCIQQWIDAINAAGMDFIFVVDNESLEKRVLAEVNFYSADIKMMRSKRKQLKNIAPNLCEPIWEKCTYAQLTPFYHAKENGIQKHWAIDADDTMFAAKPESVAKILLSAEKIAEEKNLCAFSFDMWRTKTKGYHWSFGVAYFNDNVDFCKIFDTTPNAAWKNDVNQDFATNIDLFFCYLKYCRFMPIETFYVENVFFLHCGVFFGCSVVHTITYWKDGMMINPIAKHLFFQEDFGNRKALGCIRLPLPLDFDVSKKIMQKIFHFGGQGSNEIARRLYGIV